MTVLYSVHNTKFFINKGVKRLKELLSSNGKNILYFLLIVLFMIIYMYINIVLFYIKLNLISIIIAKKLISFNIILNF